MVARNLASPPPPQDSFLRRAFDPYSRDPAYPYRRAGTKWPESWLGDVAFGFVTTLNVAIVGGLLYGGLVAKQEDVRAVMERLHRRLHGQPALPPVPPRPVPRPVLPPVPRPAPAPAPVPAPPVDDTRTIAGQERRLGGNFVPFFSNAALDVTWRCAAGHNALSFRIKDARLNGELFVRKGPPGKIGAMLKPLFSEPGKSALWVDKDRALRNTRLVPVAMLIGDGANPRRAQLYTYTYHMQPLQAAAWRACPLTP